MFYLTWDDPGHDLKLSPGTQGNAVIVDFRRKTKGMDRNMSDIQNTSTEGTQTSTEVKTFTQDDVNRIVQERLAKERSKTAGNGEDELNKRAAELDKRTADLEQRENRLNAITALRSAGYPDELADVIKCSNDNELKNSIELITKIVEERTPKGWSKDQEANRAQFTAPMISNGITNTMNSDGVRRAMGLRG